MSDIRATSGGGTTYNVVSAVFDDGRDAQRAVDWLRDQGIPNSAISVVARQGEDYRATGDLSEDDDEIADDAREVGSGALTGAGVGAAAGALFGLAAAAIPGVGPFITAGALANVLGAAGGLAAAGAIVGGTSGALAGALSHWGLSEAESRYYAGEVERGGTFVGVDLSQTSVSRDTVLDAFRRFNGRFAT
jgi:hypothetical protein